MAVNIFNSPPNIMPSAFDYDYAAAEARILERVELVEKYKMSWEAWNQQMLGVFLPVPVIMEAKAHKTPVYPSWGTGWWNRYPDDPNGK